MIEFLHRLLRMISKNSVKQLDSTQLKIIFELLSEKNLLLFKINNWAENINYFIRKLRVLDTVDFEECGLTDHHIKPLINILKYLPHVNKLILIMSHSLQAA